MKREMVNEVKKERKEFWKEKELKWARPSGTLVGGGGLPPLQKLQSVFSTDAADWAKNGKGKIEEMNKKEEEREKRKREKYKGKGEIHPLPKKKERKKERKEAWK